MSTPQTTNSYSEQTHQKYQRLVATAKTLDPMMTAVAHPCDQSSLEGAINAAEMGLIRPILVGPKEKISGVAQQFKLDISPYECIDVPHSHAAAAKAVEIVREGRAEALMKGSLHTDEVMGEVVKRDTGIRTARRISHCFVLDVPTYAEAGFPDFFASSWVGFFVPAKTGDAVVAKLNAEINDILKEADVVERLKAVGFDSMTKTQTEAAAYFKSEVETWGKMARSVGVSTD